MFECRRTPPSLFGKTKPSFVEAIERLAEQAGTSAITRRLRRMRDDGIISHEAAVLSPAIRERQATAVVHVQLDRHTPSGWAKLKRYFAETPEVQI